MKRTIKSQILDYVKSLGDDATYTQIIRFAHDCRHGADAWEKNPNRRGWFSDALSGNWYYERNSHPIYAYRVGYLIKRGVKSGWLVKKPNGRYRAVLPPQIGSES